VSEVRHGPVSACRIGDRWIVKHGDEEAAAELQWHYGPTDADPDPGKMRCDDCGGEVYALEGGYICSGCERQGS
jgi:hypothetical protein